MSFVVHRQLFGQGISSGVLIVVLASSHASVDAFAAGKGVPSNRPGAAPQSMIQTPRPLREATLRSVGTRPFQLPNGARVDLTADLESILASSVTTQTRFLPLEGGAENPDCLTRIELRANISTFEMDVADIGLSFGWTPSGELGGGFTGLTGKTNVKIGTISMDFGAWQCVGNRCVEMAASTANQATAGVNLNVEVNFSEATTGAALVWNTALGNAIRGIMEDGLKKLERNSRISKLTWYATVREVSEKEGTVLFDAGTSEALAVGDAFEIYARTPSLSACDVYKTVAAVHASRVDTKSTLADMDLSYDERGVEPGDIVLIREISK